LQQVIDKENLGISEEFLHLPEFIKKNPLRFAPDPEGFTKLLVQDLLRAIALKNNNQKLILSQLDGGDEKFNKYKDERTKSIQNALRKVKAMDNLGGYSELSAYKDQAKNIFKSFWRKGGTRRRIKSKKTRKVRKVRKVRKTKKSKRTRRR